LIFDSLSQSRALIRATDMCDPVEQLMHRVSEWFVRQPLAHAALSAALLLFVDTGSLATSASPPPRCCLRTDVAARSR